MTRAAASAPAAKRPKPASKGRAVLLIVFIPIGVVLLALAFRIAGFEAFETDGPSMEPTLLPGDRFVVDKTAFGLFLPFAREAAVTWAGPEAGDVVVLRSPFDDIDIVKRVIGVAGDRIEIREDVIYRNGAPLLRRRVGPWAGEQSDAQEHEEAIGDHTWHTVSSVYEVPETVPEEVVPPGHVFVLGDHRDRSNDSRNPRVGMIPLERLKGRAVFIYWSRQGDRVGRSVR